MDFHAGSPCKGCLSLSYAILYPAEGLQAFRQTCETFAKKKFIILSPQYFLATNNI